MYEVHSSNLCATSLFFLFTVHIISSLHSSLPNPTGLGDSPTEAVEPDWGPVLLTVGQVQREALYDVEGQPTQEHSTDNTAPDY